MAVEKIISLISGGEAAHGAKNARSSPAFDRSSIPVLDL
jgi:hypothetical protein